MIKLMLVDDHPIVRHGIRSLLTTEGDIDIVGETGDGLEAVRLAERLRPDVMVLDLHLPGLCGQDVTREATRRVPGIRTLIFSGYSEECHVLRALQSGASGYFLKSDREQDLIRAIREVAAGGAYLSPQLSARAVEQYFNQAREIPPDPYDTLTAREREVLHLAAEGYTHGQIAERLVISQRTAEHHRVRLMRKIGLTSQTDLIRYAIRRGLLPMDEPGSVPAAA